jgi:hypothetical protein
MLPKVAGANGVRAAFARCSCCLEESEDLRNTFLKEYGGDEAKFYEYW